MEKALVYAFIVAVTSIAVSFFIGNERRLYYFGSLIVAAGVAIAVWAHVKSNVSFENYVRKDILIENAFYESQTERVVIVANDGKYQINQSEYSAEDWNVITRAKGDIHGSAVIWVRPDSGSVIKGLQTAALSLDAQKIAVTEMEGFQRLRNVGVGISILGLLVFPFHYFTSARM